MSGASMSAGSPIRAVSGRVRAHVRFERRFYLIATTGFLLLVF